MPAIAELEALADLVDADDLSTRARSVGSHTAEVAAAAVAELEVLADLGRRRRPADARTFAAAAIAELEALAARGRSAHGRGRRRGLLALDRSERRTTP